MRVPLKLWDGAGIDTNAIEQMKTVASLPFLFRHAALMADGHLGKGATIGSVIATDKAIIPAAVGVDLGCGIQAVQTTLRADDLPENLVKLRSGIEQEVPVGGPGERGSWKERGRYGTPASVASAWRLMEKDWKAIIERHPKISRGMTAEQLGTLGTGNHFIEVCLDTRGTVWVMLHSGSRGLGNRIGTYFIETAKEEMRKWHINLPDADLAYLPQESEHFSNYICAAGFAQNFAKVNRNLMMTRILGQMRKFVRPFRSGIVTIDCHHNYVEMENHFGKNVWITRKGAVRARSGDFGIIPGSMGAKSFIVRGLGNPESFQSCSHGAGRRMSRSEARKRITPEEHKLAVTGIECRTDASVIDESPAAYKPIDLVMNAQRDLVEIVYELRQVLCIKG